MLLSPPLMPADIHTTGLDFDREELIALSVMLSVSYRFNGVP